MGHPRVSVVIPAYNEEETLLRQLDLIRKGVGSAVEDYELIVVENGSSDRTRQLLTEYSKSVPELRPMFLDMPDYGGAMKLGILNASGEVVHICQLDFFDADFFRESLSMISKGREFIIGSRNRRGWDKRPAQRIVLTYGLNYVLKIFFGFKGTDTHGLKTFARDRVIGFVRQCKMSKGMFDTEFTLRAQYAGLEIDEIPVRAFEIRKKRNTYFVKIFRNIKDLAVMRFYFHREGIMR
jgi:glycosyltransferase involved in cell wall biosynthesis